MRSLGIIFAAGCLSWVLTASISANELNREISLIQRLGKAEVDRAQRASEPPTASEIQAAARTIDQYIDQYYKDRNLRATPRADDDIFLRRIYLDVVGRIPTLQETLAFRRDNSANKRAELIDKLLNSEGYVQHNFSFWADVLRIQAGNNGPPYGGQPYANWVKNALRTDMPYNKMVYELITASGMPWENGAAGYYLRDDGMPLDNMSMTIQTFLGTSLVCAQCHDHPFDKWTQYEFYEMAAFTYGVRTRSQPENLRKAEEMANDFAIKRELEQMTRILQYGVSDGKRSLDLPHDYQYDDAQPHDPVKPRTIFGGKALQEEGKSLRESYAAWIIDRNNPRFTLTIANRIWKKVFGEGIIEPVDQMTDTTQPAHAELLAFLAHKVESLHFDLKQYERVLYNTQLYQRQVPAEDDPEGEVFYRPGPKLRRMTAEQFWDSLVTLVIPEPDYRRGPLSDGSYIRRARMFEQASPEALLDMAREQVQYEQARREINDKLREARNGGDKRTIDSLTKQLNDLRRPSRMAPMMMEGSANAPSSGSELDYGYDMPTKDARLWQGIPDRFVRAAEQSSPTDFGHFLRDFGQSDRQVANNSNSFANIIQVLTMFNGPVFNEVINPYSQLMKNIEKVNTPLEKVNLIYLTVLNREPTTDEKRVIEQAILMPAAQKRWEPDYARIVWALLNTREFSFVQ